MKLKMVKNSFILLCIFFMLYFNVSISLAQVEGLIIDKSRTKIGRDFYEILYLSLEAKLEEKAIFNITVDEFVDPQFGSRISVSINENIIYQNFVSSRMEDIEEKVNEATETIIFFLINWKEYERYLEEEGKIR